MTNFLCFKKHGFKTIADSNLVLFQVAIRAAFLEQENVHLKWQVAKLQSETVQLKKTLITFANAQDSGFESA
jgi:hypothetical protein